MIQDIFRKYGKVDANGNHLDGTDKATNHNYGPVYDLLFSDRESVLFVLELGVSKGYSMLAWCDIFPNAHIVGMDVDDNCEVSHQRIEHRVGDMRNIEDCDRVICGRKFDLIVDDGDHNISTTLMALMNLWPSVVTDGFYVIEDFNQGPECHASVLKVTGRFKRLFPHAEVYDTTGPRGGPEPLIVMRKQ